MCNDMSCLATCQTSALQCNSLTVLTVPCGSTGRGNGLLLMYLSGLSISNGGNSIVEIVGTLLWSLVLLLRRAASVANVTSAGRLGT